MGFKTKQNKQKQTNQKKNSYIPKQTINVKTLNKTYCGEVRGMLHQNICVLI